MTQAGGHFGNSPAVASRPTPAALPLQPGEPVAGPVLLRLLADLGVSGPAARSLLLRMRREGWLTSQRVGRQGSLPARTSRVRRPGARRTPAGRRPAGLERLVQRRALYGA
ncbi:MAG: hypothetical protein ACRDOK_13650 [Streptosporangiaceae bacterium]